MFFYVCSGVSVPEMNRCLPDWTRLAPIGHDFVLSTAAAIEHPRPDAIILMSVSCTDDAAKAMERWPGVPLFAYHWDSYSWVWTNPRSGEYDYRRYGALLKRAKSIWTPSRCTSNMLRYWWDLPSCVVWPSVPAWDAEDTTDHGYALCTLREQPDHHWGWFEQACIDAGIPFRMTKHGLPLDKYKDEVAHCRFIVSHMREASTGGLSLLEAYRLGKPVLVNGSGWNGAAELFGYRASIFNSYKDLVFKLRLMFDSPTPIDPTHRQWVDSHFSDSAMLLKMLERINAHFGKTARTAGHP